MKTKTDKVCGNCKYWIRSIGKVWGKCGVKLPAWAKDKIPIPYMINENHIIARSCDCFELKEEK
jgi:hypothetical protein